MKKTILSLVGAIIIVKSTFNESREKEEIARVIDSNKGLRRAVTEALAGEGVNLVICSRNEKQILITVENILKIIKQ